MRVLYLFVLLFCNFTCLLAQEDLSKLSYGEINAAVYREYGAGNYEGAIPYTEAGRSKSLQEFGTMDSIYVGYTSNLGFFYKQLGKYEKAEKLYLEVLEAEAKKIGKEHPEYAMTLNNLAALYQAMGNTSAAEKAHLEAKRIREKVLGKEDPVHALSLNNLGAFYYELGRYEEAEAMMLEAIKIRAKVLGREHPQYISSISNLAALYQDIGNYAEAEALCLEATSFREKVLGKEHPAYANSLIVLALLYQKMKKWDEVESLLLTAKKIREKVLGKENRDYTSVMLNLAKFYKEVGRYENAEKIYLEVKDLMAKVLGKDHPDYSITVNNLAELCKETGHVAQAKKYLLEAKGIWEKNLKKENYRFSIALSNLANLYLNVNELDSAWMFCSLAFDANSAQIDSNFTNWTELDKYEYYSNDQTVIIVKVLKDVLHKQYQQSNDKNKLEECYKVLQATMRFNEKARHKFTSEKDKLRVMKNNADFVQQAINIALLLKKNTYIEETFTFAEMNKSALLADALKGSRARTLGDLPDTLVDKEVALQEKMSDIKKRQQQAKTPEEKEQLNKDLNILNQEVNAFLKSLKNKYPKYHALKYENITAKALDVQKVLADKTILLEYFLADSAVYLFVINKTKIKLYPLNIKIENLKKQIKNLRNALTDYTFLLKNEKEAYLHYTEAAYWFYKELVEIAIKDENAENLIIVTDGELGHLPFEAFLVEHAPQAGSFKDLHYLVKDYNISYNYSATILLESNASAKDKKLISNGKILACAANYTPLDSNLFVMRLPHFYRLRTHLQPLPAAQQEIATLAQNFEGQFLWNDSTNERYFKEQAQYYSIIHLAMHGILDKKTPMYSSLAFTENRDSVEDNFLQAFEIAHLKLNAQLVVLSACETGYGNFEQGEGVVSLARSFMYAGVPSLIVSLWQVNDHSTAEIMKGFYQNLANGMDKAVALRKAKLDYILIANGVLAHPAFWSPFIQLGDNAPIYVAKGGKNIFLWLGIGLVLCAGFFWWRRKRVKM